MPSFRPLRHAAALAGAVGLALTSAGGASAAATPGWRVVKTLGPSESTWTEDLAVSGPRDAWSIWQACRACASTQPVNLFYVEHTDGGAWRRVPVPSSFGAYATGAIAIGASSARDAWLFYGGNATHDKVLRWNGSAWRLQAIPAWVVRFNESGNYWADPVVFGPTSVWVFSVGQASQATTDHFASRYNGKRWTKISMPGSPEEVKALSPSDIWVLGQTVGTSRPRQILMHWNGKRWHTVRIPAAHPPTGATEHVRDLVAGGPAGVWLQRELLQGSAGARTLYLLHWNGRSWRRVKLGIPTSDVNVMAQDGHRGVWMAAYGPAPRYRLAVYHLNAGRWTRYAVPAVGGTSVMGLLGLAWIPGTRSLWATGQMLIPHKTNGVVGAILKYGR